jgi:hypothetical protein
LEAVFILLEFLSPLRRIFIGSHSLPPLWFAVSVLQRHIARPPQRRRETSIQASRWIFNEGDVGQPRSAEAGTQLKPLLERFPILLVGRIFNGDSVVTFADFTIFFCLALTLLWNIYKSRRGSWVGDKLRNVIRTKQKVPKVVMKLVFSHPLSPSNTDGSRKNNPGET